MPLSAALVFAVHSSKWQSSSQAGHLYDVRTWKTLKEDAVSVQTKWVEETGGQKSATFCGHHKRIHSKANEGRVQPLARTPAPSPVARRDPPSSPRSSAISFLASKLRLAQWKSVDVRVAAAKPPKLKTNAMWNGTRTRRDRRQTSSHTCSTPF